MNVSLIAPCGMNRGICMAYLRVRNICLGCLGEKENKSNYPCLRLKQLDKRYRTKICEELYPLEDSSKVNEWRKEIGLPPLEERRGTPVIL